MLRQTLVALSSAAALSACATASPGGVATPDYEAIPVQKPPAHASLYAGCLAQAIDAGAYGRAQKGETRVLIFTCIGPPAAAFYTALEGWSVEVGSAFEANGRRYRATAAVRRDLFGLDYCSVAAGNDDPQCVLTFSAGEFLDR